jgi:riboflavin synthase
MFTGLIDDVGTIESVAATAAGREFRIACRYDDLAAGESVAVQGACLTVRTCGPRWFTVAAVTTTLERTALGSWMAGRRVNLERALAVGARLGGHIVQGHVDGVGRVIASGMRGDAFLVDIAIPPSVAEVLVPQGSIAVDGVSMTVNALPARDVVQLSVIEFTRRHTTLGGLRPQDAVHVEGDIVGKYVRQLVAPYMALHGSAAAFEAPGT